MKKVIKYILYINLLFSIFPAFSEVPQRTAVGPGVWHHDIYLTEGPWAIHILEIDLTNEYVHIETAKAKQQLEGRELTSEIARSNSRAKHRVIGAVNGDFFSESGVPVGAQISDGTLACNPYPRSVFGIGGNKNPFIAIVSLEANAFTQRNLSCKIHRVNSHRGENELILYNKYRGQHTGTNQWGAEVIVKLSTQFFVNDTIRGIVTTIDSINGNNRIESEHIILSGHNNAGLFLKKHIRKNDSLKVYLGLPPVKNQIQTMIGGMPRIIRDGKRSVEFSQEKISEQFATARHPRTAVGFSKDGKKIYFVTVDGRQPGFSVGMSLYELADFMLNFGAHQSMNLDGGGSTTMVIGNRVVNRPSDSTGERPVANALLAISTAPTGRLSYIRIEPDLISLQPGQSFKFNARGFDQFYNPVTLDSVKYTWSCDQRIGSVNQQGVFTAKLTANHGYIHVSAGEIVCSAKIRIAK